MRFPVTCPRAAGEGGERPSTPIGRSPQRRQTAPGRSVILTLPGPPGEQGSIARGVRRWAQPGSTSRAVRVPEGEVSLPPAAWLLRRRPVLRGSGRPLGAAAVTARRAWSESWAANQSRSETCHPGGKQKPRTSGRDRPRLDEGERGGGGERLRPLPRSAPPGESPGPEAPEARHGPRSAAGPPARSPRGFPGPVRPYTLLQLGRSARGRGRERPRRDREGGNSVLGGATTARPTPAAMAPVPVAAVARRLRPSLPSPRPTHPSARPAGRPRAGQRRLRLAAPASRPESPGQRPAPSRPRRPQDPPSIGP